MFGFIKKTNSGSAAVGDAVKPAPVQPATAGATSDSIPSDLAPRVQAALDRIRPALQMDGGDVELVGIDGYSVKVRLTGHCVGCPSAQMTLQYGIERALRDEIPELENVDAEF